jgi:type I restriction-modification system DNA methylase subunit
MSLFQHSILKKQTAACAVKIQASYQAFAAYFLDPAIQANIRSSKEEQFQEGFLRELFVNVLGYTLNPSPNYNLITEKKNVADAKKADAAIILDGTVKAIIELKDHKTTDLKQVEAQAFGYKNNNLNTPYVITSNFEKLRFYIDNTIDYKEFHLFNLSEEEFATMWICLAYENLSTDLPKRLKSESTSTEDHITKQLYKDYSAFKRALFDDLTTQNPTMDKLLLFRKTQKVLDRLLFVFFAEDKGLLPPNSMQRILEQWEERNADPLNEYQPLYGRLKLYFHYMDVGHKGKKEDIFGYNGGLFKEDETLDNLRFSDEILKNHILKLSAYDFDTEIDVNILGHIFENSLGEIEEITTQIARGFIPLSETTTTISKRKKDGVFYTPRYITTYIVENTLGKLCTDKKEELGLIETAYFIDAKRTKTQKKQWIDTLNTYRDWLLSLTICDPACGSGAFLNAALDFLIKEHHYLDELNAKVFGSSIVFPDIENTILENNLYGVDINEESVEIAKLALWLRTAQPHRKLNSLNDNIKCGNSLISDPTVAGDKAFDWQKEFPQVFEKGGFDVVIGNPPYVRFEHIKETSQKVETQHYDTFDKRGDIYCVFVERGFQILKSDGYISYIMPNKWMQAGYGTSLRRYFLSKRLLQLIDFGDIQIFSDATTYPCIFVARNAAPTTEMIVATLGKDKGACPLAHGDNPLDNMQTEIFRMEQFGEDTWVISSQKDKTLLERLARENKTLEEVIGGQAYRGILTGLTEAFLIDNETKERLIKEDIHSSDLIRPVLRGRDIMPYTSVSPSTYLIATLPSLKLDITKYPAIEKYLLSFGYDRLKQTGEYGARKKTSNQWFETQDSIDYWQEFAAPKIMYQTFQVKPCFIYDTKSLFCNNSMWIIPLKDGAMNPLSLLAILNSRMGWWLITKYCTQIQNGYQLIWKYFSRIPIPENIPDELSQLAGTMISLNGELQEKLRRFNKRLSDNLNTNKGINPLAVADFKQFLAELKKQKVVLTLKQQDEWEEYFDGCKAECRKFADEIKMTEAEIDWEVCELYGLDEKEIEIIE